MSVATALEAITKSVRLQGAIDLPPEQAFGRITAAPAVATRLVPPVRMSAMDGFALCSGDTARATLDEPTRLSVSAADARAGQPAVAIASGTAIRISTGGSMPDGADHVLAREHAALESTTLLIDSPRESGRNVRAAGEDFAPGDTIIEQARLVTPAAIAAMVASGVTKLSVRARPRVALFSTGSELLDPAGLARDSNGPMIAAMCREAGVDIDLLGAVADHVDAIEAAIDRAAPHDLLLSSGGVSGGEHDHVRAALERRGARIIFHGLPMRPGKPVLFATLADGRPFFGLPGNPVAALVGFRFFVTTALRAMVGLDPEQGRAVATTALPRRDTTIFLRGSTSIDRQGRIIVSTDLDQRSHILSSVALADCWLRVELHAGRTTALAYPQSCALDGWRAMAPVG